MKPGYAFKTSPGFLLLFFYATSFTLFLDTKINNAAATTNNAIEPIIIHVPSNFSATSGQVLIKAPTRLNDIWNKILDQSDFVLSKTKMSAKLNTKVYIAQIIVP